MTFTLSGAGALSADTAPTDDAGRAEVLRLAPLGTSTATIAVTSASAAGDPNGTIRFTFTFQPR